MLLASTGTSYLLLLSARPATTKEPTGSWQCRYGNLSILPLIKTCPRYRNLYFSAGKLYSHSQKLLPTKYLSFEKQFLLSKETTLSLSFSVIVHDLVPLRPGNGRGKETASGSRKRCITTIERKETLEGKQENLKERYQKKKEIRIRKS